MIKRILFLFLISISIKTFSQEMQAGFTYLEQGKYIKAKLFFENILKTYPQNRTARLCYGRAIGLTGNSNKAVSIFTLLKSEYPNDFEIKLNYAESLLWHKEYTKAELFYKQLVAEKKLNFPAVLGYANTLSNLKNYKKALKYVNKALQIQNKNKNALVSRKYIRLGYANIFSQNKEFEKALQLLDKNLIDFPNDKDTLLNKANLYLTSNNSKKAAKVYIALSTNPKDSIIGLNGLALVAHKEFKNKKALELATAAKKKVENYKNDQKLFLATQERYVQALLWNEKFTAAKKNLKSLEVNYSKNPQIWSLQATQGMYTSDFKTSLRKYTSILNLQKKSFDGNLGIANAYRAVGKDFLAYEYAFKTLQFYPKQPDAEKLIATLKKIHTPWAQHKMAFTFDNGNNEAFTTSLFTEVPFSTKLKTNLEYTYRKTENTITRDEASTNELALHFLYKFNQKISVISKGGLSKSDAITNDYIQWTSELKLKTKPFRRHNLDIGYQRMLQNFNADLIDREIVMNNYSLNYNLSTLFNFGWYTQIIYTSQTDSNTRNLLFTSIYYSFLKRPTIKAGINYQYISFKNQVPTIYFSPNSFNAIEIFTDLISNHNKKWFYAGTIATGYQYIEENAASTTFRTDIKLGYQITNRFSGTLYSKYSNIASATAAGFRFTEFGLLLKWYFLKQPIFNKKIMSLKIKQNP